MISSKKTGQIALTIAMPVFNAGNNLALAVMSVINQSFQNWELFIVDDGSTDNCINSLSWVADERVSIIKNHDNRGLAYRLNEIIEMARGDYFARMDQDDVCHPLRLEKQLDFMKKNNSYSLIGTKCVALSQRNHYLGELSGILDHSDITQRPWHEIRIAHPTWFGKTSWFKKYKYKYPASFLSEDQELLLRAKDDSKYFVLPEYLLGYRIGRATKLNKKFITRLSLLRLRSIYFYNKSEYMNLMLTVSAFLACIIKDAIDAFFPLSQCVLKFRNRNKHISEQERFWVNLIEENLEQVRMLQSKCQSNQS